MDTEDFDPLTSRSSSRANADTSKRSGTNSPETDATVRMLVARQEAFRSIADRFYMLWWNLPSTPIRQVDQEIIDLFRKYMELAPSLGVSRNGIPELRECCGRKRSAFEGEIDLDLSSSISGARQLKSPFQEPAPAEPVEVLGFLCPGDLIRRVTRLLGFKFCQRCDDRRRKINAFFGCGKDR